MTETVVISGTFQEDLMLGMAKFSLRKCLTIMAISLFMPSPHNISADHAEDLWTFLFTNKSYNKHLRPVVNASTQMMIDLKLNVVAIIDFSEVEETFTLTAFLPLSWKDETLSWDPELFGNLTHMSVPQDKIWKPYINLQNSVVKLGELGTPSLQVLVEHTGVVVWKPVEVFTVLCSVDVYKFPFDTQTCYLSFEPSGYKLTEVLLTTSVPVINFREYEGNSGWTIVSSEIVAKTEHEDSYAICSITLKRKPLYFLMNIFLPIMLLSILNMLVFVLPVESGEKASFVVTVFLSLAVFLTIVSGKLPENSETISLLNIYVFVSTLVSTLVAIVTIIHIRLHNRDHRHPVPHYLQKLTKFISGSGDMRICHLDEKRENENNFNGKENSNNNPVQCSKVPVATSEIGGDITWPSVVRALDKLFFGVFLFCYFIITVCLIGIAVNE